MPLPREVREELMLCQGLLRSRRERVRWIPESNLHLTGAFLGEVDAAAARDLPALLDRLAEAHAPKLRLAGNGWFGPDREPRVLWTGVEDSEGLLQKQVEALQRDLRRAGQALEKRRYRPHVSIGRVKQGSAELCAAWLQAPPRALEFRPEGWGLYESRLKERGAEYRLVHLASFAKRVVRGTTKK